MSANPTAELDADILKLASDWCKVVARNEKTHDETGHPDKIDNDARWAIERELAGRQAHTIAGIICKLSPVLFDDHEEGRRKLLEGAVADLERLARTAVADPALGLVAEWWQRHRAVWVVERRPGVFKFGTPENNRKEADMAAALRRRHAIVDLIITTPPTTAEGMAAVAEIVAVSLRIAHGDDASEPVGWERLLLALRPHRRHADDGTEIAARTGGAA